jgi:hypothetical protein
VRPFPLTTLQGGINRLVVKGTTAANRLYDLVNAYVTNEGTVQPREGTARFVTLDTNSVGLMSNDGIFNIFGSTFTTSTATVPPGFQLNLLINPVDPSATPIVIWFAKPFMGFPYVVAEFSDGRLYHYWLQTNGTWTSSTVYTTGSIVTPTPANGLAYLAVRDFPQQPLWTADTIITSGSYVEPNEYTGYAYKAIAVAGTNPHTGASEPVWPTVEAGQLQEFGDFDTSASDAGTTQAISTATAQALGANITDRYGDSSDISGSGTPASTNLVLPTTASTKVTTWKAGTLYAPGAVVIPTNTQGAFTNAIPNGDFENGNDGNWDFVSSATNWQYSNTGTYQGSWCLEFPTGATQAGGDFAIMNNFSTCTPGQSVTASAYLNPANAGANLDLWIQLNWYNAASSLISSTVSLHAEGGGYRKVSVTGVAPATATQVKLAIGAGSGTNSRNNGFADLCEWSLETPALISNFLYEAVQAAPATSAPTQPTWPTIAGTTVIDGGVTWEAIGTSIITWEAVPLMLSGLTQPVFSTSVGISVQDPSTFTDANGSITGQTSMSWVATNRQVIDTSGPGLGSQGSLGDPTFSSVSLLMHFDGNFTDSSLNNYPMAASGHCITTTSPVEFGTGALLQPDSATGNNSYVATTFTAGSPLDLFSTLGDFTIEWWGRYTGTADVLYLSFYLSTNAGVDLAQIYVVNGGTFDLTWPGLGTTVGGLTTGTYQAYAITRQAGLVRQFINGVLVNSVATAQTFPTDTLWIGLQPGFGGGIDPFYMDELRITKGLARYTATYTTSSIPFANSVLPVLPPAFLAVALGASHVFTGDNDIVEFSAAVNPLDWTSTDNAGYLPTGLNNYGDNPVAMLALYRSNLCVFNAGGYQMWQIDPDPANMALLDAQPIGSIWQRAAQSVANDLLFLTEVGVRNLATVGATANLAIGNTGQPIDPLVKAQLNAGTYSPISLYYPGRGQYWLFFGPQAFVLTMNGSGQKSWSRYVFPATITDWTLNAGVLYMRTATNLVWSFTDQVVGCDDAPGSAGAVNIPFNGIMQWPYLNAGVLGLNKMMVGIDIVGDGNVFIQVAYNQGDKSSFNDSPLFTSSTSVTAPYLVTIADTVPEEPLPFPCNAPSYSVILTFAGSSTTANAWTWEALNLYLADASGGGATG